LETADGEEIEYLTTLASSVYDPIDVISIYTPRTVIEILFRELKQYLNIENFHSQSLNGVLFELFASLIGLVLVYWLRHRHPVKGGVPRAIQKVRTLVRIGYNLVWSRYSRSVSAFNLFWNKLFCRWVY